MLLRNPNYLTPLYADRFKIFNETYALADHETCASCNGVGGHSSQELRGDWPYGVLVSFFSACPNCIGAEKCPDCLQPLALSFDQSAFGEKRNQSNDGPFDDYWTNPDWTFTYEDALAVMPFVGFTCLVCGWQFDPQREVAVDNDYYDGYDDGYIDESFEGYPGTGGFY